MLLVGNGFSVHSRQKDEDLVRLAEGELTAAYMGVEMVGAGAVFFEGAEESARFFPERSGTDIAGVDRKVDVAVVGGIADGNREIAGVEFDIFIAGDSFDRDFAGGTARVEIDGPGNVDANGEVVFRSAGDVKFGRGVRASEACFDVLNFVHVLTGELDRNFVVCARKDADFAGADVQAELRFGSAGEIHLRFAGVREFGFGVWRGKGGEAEDEGECNEEKQFHGQTFPALHKPAASAAYPSRIGEL